MKNSIILIYFIFTGFISFNNYVITEKSYQSNYKYQNFKDNSSNCDSVLELSSGKSNHKLNHTGNSKSEVAYLNDVTNTDKLIACHTYKKYPYKHLILHKRINIYHKNKFLPIFTQSDKTIQSEFLII